MKDNKTSGLSRRKLLQTGAGLTAAVGSGATLALGTSNGDIEWHQETDIIVCGSGAAGGTAAMAAGMAGATVTLLEKSAVWGGTSAKAGFHIWIPDNHAMRAAGLKDDRDSCLKFMAEHSYPHLFDENSPTLGLSTRNFRLLETYYDEAAPTVELLSEWNVSDFRIAALGEKNIEAVDYNDNSRFNTAIVGRSMEPVDEHGNDSFGRHVVARFRQRMTERGVDILMQHKATALHRNAAGEVIGLQARNAVGDAINIRAKKGVVFGSGCYSANKDYMTQYQMMPVMGSCGAPSNTGDFIAIAGSAGAQLGNLSGAWRAQVVLEHAADNLSTPTAVFWPIGDSMLLVNKYGRRCCNEKRNYNDRTKGLYNYDAVRCEFPDMINFMVFDQRCAELYAGIYPLPQSPDQARYILKGDTLDALAGKLKLHLASASEHTGNLTLGDDFTANIEASVKQFNGYAEDGIDPDFHRGESEYDRAWHSMHDKRKNTRWDHEDSGKNVTMYPLQSSGPYYAIVLLPGCIGTNGGPLINEHAQVLDYDYKPIPGLYGAGNCIASPSVNAYWGGGTTIGNALTFGRLAGQHAAAQATREA